MADILIIDDEPNICRLIEKKLSREGDGNSVQAAHSLKQARRMMAGHDYDLVLLDVQLPDGIGLDLLPDINAAPSPPVVIVITAYAGEGSAKTAIKSGVWDYLEKPFSTDDMLLTVNRALKYREAQLVVRPVYLKRQKIIGDSPEIQACLDLATKAAMSDITVLIQGETGTGKELIAEAIHENSRRGGHALIVLDCTVLPENLMESTLFGHARGAFTGADAAREGLIQQADGTTLFLDEIGELPPGLQKKLLRVLQEQRYRPVGSDREMMSDFRLIVATHRDLDRMVADGTFREDLLYRLNSYTIHVPALRERKADIEPIATYHMNRLCRRYRLSSKQMMPDFVAALEAYDWPGNVRELVNTMDRVLAVARQEPVVYPIHLPDEIRIKLTLDGLKHEKQAGDARFPESVIADQPLKEVREQAVARAESAYLLSLMRETGGDVDAACRIAMIGKSQLYALLKKYDIDRRRI